MRENEPRSDGEIKTDDELELNTHQKKPGILQMVFGQSSEDKESALRQKLLEKKAKLTEENLRQRLLEKRVAVKEKSPSPVKEKPKSKRKRSSSSSSSLSSAESTPPKRKKKSHKKKKSKKKAKEPAVNQHFKDLKDKSVLNRVIIRHLNPQDEENKKHKKKAKKSKSLRSARESEEERRRNKRSPPRRNGNRGQRRDVDQVRSTQIVESHVSEIEINDSEDDSPIPSPNIFLYQHYMQDEELQSTSCGEFAEGSVEAKPFEELTEEEKATLSPTLLSHKENFYQKQLISKLPIFYPGISGCRSVEEFSILNRIEEGTFGVVYRAIELATDEIVALKRLKMEKEKDGFPITSLREINMLMKCRNHANVVGLREIVVGSTMDKIYLSMEYVDHDMKVLLKQMDEKKKKFKMAEVKTLMQQLLAGCAYLHSEWVIHRDLKTSNLLLSQNNVLKIGDFGLAREFGDPLKAYTPVVVTLWYRSPELLLGCKKYSTAVDVWSIGCIFGEFLHLKPIFQGSSEIDQLNKIFMDTGVPNNTIWPGFEELPGISRCVFANTPYNQLRKKFMSDLKSEAGLDLMNKLLTLDPNRRIHCDTALKHPFFIEEPKPASLDSFQTFPSKSEDKALVPTRLNLPSNVADKSGLLPLDRNRQQLLDELEIDSVSLAKNGFSLNLGIKK